MDDDDVLYEQFQYEMEHGTPHPDVAEAQELEQLLAQLENEQQRLFLQRNVRRRNEPVRWPDFVNRRPYLVFLLRNLLILDHILMILFLPFSVFTLLKTVINKVTFSDADMLNDIVEYVHNRIVVDPKSSVVYLYRGGDGLLGCFHNSVVYHSAPFYKYLMKMYGNSNFLRQLYTITVKWFAVSTFTLYGLVVSMYLSFLTFFFIVCVTLLFIKKFKGVDLMIANILQTCDLIF